MMKFNYMSQSGTFRPRLEQKGSKRNTKRGRRLVESGSEEEVVPASVKLSRSVKYREFLDRLINH